MALTSLGYGRLRVRWGDGRLIRGSQVLWVVALLLMGVVPSPALLVAAAVLFGIGMGVVVPALTSVVADAVPEGLRGRATAVLATATFGGQVIAPLAIGPVAGSTSLGGGFVAAAALALVGAGLSLTVTASQTSTTTTTTTNQET